jgi:AcrR family transcriptional regulator
MSTQERKQREFAKREQRFLAAAREQICQDGLLSLQMAKVARSCDYATGTLYQHFSSKEDLLVAICAEMAATRVNFFQRVADWQAPSRERMFAIAVADMLFAHRYPEHFRLAQFVFTEVIWQAASPQRRRHTLEVCKPMGLIVERIVNDAIATGDLDTHGRPPMEMSIGQWTMTLGMHNLVHAEGVLDLYDLKDPYRIMLSQVQMLLNGMNWQPPINPFDEQLLSDKINHVCSTLFGDMCTEKEQR